MCQLRLASAASEDATLLEELAGFAASLQAPAAASISAVSALLGSTGRDLLPLYHERAISVLAALTSSGAACGVPVPRGVRRHGVRAGVRQRGRGARVRCAASTGGGLAGRARRDVAAFPDLLPMVPRRGGARPLLLQMVSLGIQRAQELALGCPRGDGRWAVVVFVTSAAAASLLLDVEPPACVAAASLLAAAAPRGLPLWLCHPPELSSTLLPPVL